jgi:Carbohydrate esterase, sialic acid-specific acetylesterase
MAAEPAEKARTRNGCGAAGRIDLSHLQPRSGRTFKLRNNVGFLMAGALIGAVAARFGAPSAGEVDLSAIPDPGRIERPCDASSGRTAVIIVHGQSNAANFGSSRYAARRNVDNFDPATGKCFAAADPLLGADGPGGNFATRLGDLLIETGRYQRVVIVPLAVKGASLSALIGEYAGRIDNVTAKLKAAQLAPTHILFQQGETDAVLTTTPAQYVTMLHTLVARFRAAGFDAPFYLSQSTKCNVADPKNAAAVRAGQEAAVDAALNIRRGPDTDSIGSDGRNPGDGCHMNQAGTLANAALWATFID